MTDPSTFLGIKLTNVVAGLAGGVVRSIVRPGGSWPQALGACVVGALTAAYLTPVAVYYIPGSMAGDEMMSGGTEGAVGFLLGLCGMAASEGLLKLAQRWRNNPTIPPSRS